jgi:hypothetical protein
MEKSSKIPLKKAFSKISSIVKVKPFWFAWPLKNKICLVLFTMILYVLSPLRVGDLTSVFHETQIGNFT